MINRRQVVAGVALVLTGGCLSDRGSDSQPNSQLTETESPTNAGETPSDVAVTTSSTEDPQAADETETSECWTGYAVDVYEFDPAEQLPVSVEEPADQIVAEAVENGETEIVTYGGSPIRDGAYVEFDGAYYRLQSTERDSEDVTAYEFELSWRNDRETPREREVLSFEDLPAADQRAIRFGVEGPKYESKSRSESGLRHHYAAPYPDGRNESKLLERDSAWVRDGDRIYFVSIGDETTRKRRTYVYEATRVASDAASFEDYVVERYVIDLNGLSEAGRSVVEAAIGGGYEECEPASDGIEDLSERLTDEKKHPWGGWYVSFESDRYYLELGNWEI